MEPMTVEDYEMTLHEYGAGFDDYMISEVCRVLTGDQIEVFRHYLDMAEQQLTLPN